VRDGDGFSGYPRIGGLHQWARLLSSAGAGNLLFSLVFLLIKLFFLKEKFGYRSLNVKQVTTDAVLIEVASLLSAPNARWMVLQVKDTVDAARKMGIVEIVHADEPLIECAWGLYRNRPMCINLRPFRAPLLPPP
jgi:hypothetical protein